MNSARVLFPSRSIALLMAIGFVDLVLTATLYHRGLITEMNPIMKPLLARSEWMFALVKGATLVAAWIAMARYAKTNLTFVRQACLFGSALYLALWAGWFISAA